MKRLNSILLLIVILCIFILSFSQSSCKKVEYCEANNVGIIIFDNQNEEEAFIFIDNSYRGIGVKNGIPRSSNWLSPGIHTYSYFIEGLPQAIVETVDINKCSRIEVELKWEDPFADFKASDTIVSVGDIISFTDLSTNEPSEWLWDFGDGSWNFKRIQNPSHSYTKAGIYTISLTTTNSGGLSFKETKNNYIEVRQLPPVVDFTADKTIVKEGESVKFTDQSTNGPTNWSWSFGDGGTSTEQNPLHSYSTAGLYTVSLTATNSAGSNSETKNNYITVKQAGIAPVAMFNADKTVIEEGESVQFTDQSTNEPTSWLWDFGDGGTSTVQNPLYKYTTSGTYSVSLIATNRYGSDTEIMPSFTTVKVLGPVTDIEGNVYTTLKIGTQYWMTENLRATKYNDGSAIPQVTDSYAWASISTPAYCWYRNDSATYKVTYGALYNWYAVNTRKLCPAGWHVPSRNEFQELLNTFGDSPYFNQIIAGGKLKEAGTIHWANPNTGATNESGFTGLPGGLLNVDGTFGGLGTSAFFWMTTEYSSTTAWYLNLLYFSESVSRSYKDKTFGQSVRCLKD